MAQVHHTAVQDFGLAFIAALGLAAAAGLGLTEGNALLFIVLVASGSYIAVPAAMRLALQALVSLAL